ncbi:hypothetical protein [Nonomuraea sp. NPDC049480]|uniref:hypothetical protein n=1 Tax=Nonomuraea sp. NPDC049480 TaxID=3364353 RepID=UPI0037A3CB8F
MITHNGDTVAMPKAVAEPKKPTSVYNLNRRVQRSDHLLLPRFGYDDLDSMSISITYVLNELSLCRKADEERLNLHDAAPNVEALLRILILIQELRASLDKAEAEAINEARKLHARWSDLAGPLGVSCRAAAERRASRLRDRVADKGDGLSDQLYASD